jgi:inorganic triphosphatase YgiF
VTAAHVEIELKFLVPAASRAAVAAELARVSSLRRLTLNATYLDTEDLVLARAGLAWRLRREAGQWVQALKAARPGGFEHFEHEVIRPDASPDPEAHADTPAGRELLRLLKQAREAGREPGVRFQTQVRRQVRRIRSGGAIIEVALDEGRLLASGTAKRLREIEFELVSGPVPALMALAERWRRRFGLVLDPRNKAERGHALAAARPDPPLRKAATPRLARDATLPDTLGAVFDECLAQINCNAIGLVDGDAEQRAEHVHQLRVGIRRLRSALRASRGWVAEPPAELVEGLRTLFAALGQARDRDVLAAGIAAELALVAGAPTLQPEATVAGVDAAALVRSPDTQGLMLAWLTWRATLETTMDEAPKRLVKRLLRRWHAGLVKSYRTFAELDAAALHLLRKRVKRQRYVLDFFAPLLPRKDSTRHLQALAAAQDELGRLNDLAVAREHYRALSEADPKAWFAVGWLTARLDEARERAREELGRLAALTPI